MMLGKNILKLRKRNGLSQEQLGAQINVTRQTISNWELGATTPNSEQLKLLSRTLNASVDELIDNDERNRNVINQDKNAGILTAINGSRLTKSILMLVSIIIIILIFYFGGDIIKAIFNVGKDFGTAIKNSLGN